MPNKINPILRWLYYPYYFLIGGPIFVLVTVLSSCVIVVACYLGFGDWAARWPGYFWGRLSLYLHLCPVKIQGREHLPCEGETYVVVANHQSMFDIFVLYGYIQLPFKWVLKESLRHMPWVGRACQAANFIFVDHNKPSSISQTMTQGKATLERGHSIFIFPEGSRSSDGSVSRFKKGAFVMADALSVPLLPITIDGAYHILPKGEWLPSPHTITLTIHKPFSVAECGEPPLNITYATRQAQQTIASALTPNSIKND